MLVPTTIVSNRYRIEAAIGRGGMGVVYRATDLRLGSQVALKQLAPETSSLLTTTKARLAQHMIQTAFEQEAELLARLGHPALPKVTDRGSDPSGDFLIMDFVEGPDLGQELDRRGAPFPPRMVLNWADQILDALEYLHGEGITHRDIKPNNIKVVKGRIKLLDFGIAKSAVALKTLVVPSIAAYTPHYSPLEQMNRAGMDIRSDLYSLAATLYHLVTNVLPTEASLRVAALLDKQPDPLLEATALNPAIPAPMSAILHQALSITMGPRPANASVFRAALRQATLATLLQTEATAPLPVPSTSVVSSPVKPVVAHQNQTTVLVNAPKIVATPPVQTGSNATPRLNTLGWRLLLMVGLLLLTVGLLIIVLIVGGSMIMRRYDSNTPQTAGVGSVAPTTNIVAIAPSVTTTPTFIATPTIDETHVALTHAQETAIAAQATASAAQENGNRTALSDRLATIDARDATTAAQNEAATATAIYEQKALANYVATSETAAQEATATVETLNQTITSLGNRVISTKTVESGSIRHNSSKKGYERISITSNAKNFILSVEFYNPYTINQSAWDFGIGFPSGDSTYCLVVTSDEYWSLFELDDSSTPPVIDEYNQDDRYYTLNTAARGSNTIKLHVYNDRLWFYLNDEFIKEIELDQRSAGDVWIGAGIRKGHQQEDEQTNYDDVTLEILPSR